MNFFEIILISVALAMDAFSVSLSKGMCMDTIDNKVCVKYGLVFGGFQGIMPFLGWLMGSRFGENFFKYGSYIAFITLFLVGGKMLYEAFTKEEDIDCEVEKNDNLLILGIATSIDAFAVGTSFALIGNIHISHAVAIIALVTFTFSYAGVFLGKTLSGFFGKYSEFFGGAAIMIIGVKILLQEIL